MKIIKIYTGVFFLIFFMACRDNSNTNTETNEQIEIEANDRFDDAKRTRENINTADSLNNDAVNDRNDSNRNTSEINPADNNRMNKMFADLNFTPEQIEEFNTNYRKDLEEWKANNPNVNIGSEQHLQMEDKQMKSLLSAAQYQQYQKWIEDNPIENQL